jgi:hypothetical protein
MALPPGTTILSKGARKFYEDAGPSFEVFNHNDTPEIPLTFNQTDFNGIPLPPPVDPRGQVPVPWSLNPVAHVSRSRVRQEAPFQVRAPTRNYPSSRVGFTYGRVPTASTSALSRASAQAHAASRFGSPPLQAPGRSLPQSLPPQGYMPQPQPLVGYAPPLQPQQLQPQAAPPVQYSQFSALQPVQYAAPAQQQVQFTTPHVQQAPVVSHSNDDMRKLASLLLESLSAPPALPAPASQATILNLTDMPALTQRPDPLESLGLPVPGTHVAPQSQSLPDDIGRDPCEPPPAKRAATEGDSVAAFSDVSMPDHEASSLIPTSPPAGEVGPQTSKAPTPAPTPAPADRRYASLHQQAFGALDLQQALQFAATAPKTVPNVPTLAQPMNFQAPAQPQQSLWQGYTIPHVSLENNIAHENLLDNLDGNLNPMDGALRPQDSVSQSGTDNVHFGEGGDNPLQHFEGLESSMLLGMFQAMPKPSLGIIPSPLTNALWFHMRGFSTGADRWPKADQIGKTYTAETAPAFRPPKTPAELPLSTPASLALDELLMKRQRNFAAPGHIIAAHMAELESGAIIPLREALQSTQDPRARQRIEQSIQFLQGRAATQLGYALRSIAASYNELASERKANLSKVQSLDLQRVIKEHKLGFLTFFEEDIAPAVQMSAAATQLRLTQAALTRFTSFNRGGGGGNRGGQANNRKPNNNNNNANPQSKENQNPSNRGRGGQRRRNGGRGRGKGRGGFNQASAKPADKE